MKLISCHIENFGKLSNLSLEFNEGINVINEANAWGKSTLAAFLKAMFYGLDAKKETGAFEKERVLYRPWQGGSFGGEVDFEVDGKRYRVSRTFGVTEKTDQFYLYDLSTNLESTDYSEKLGEELFDLDSASFKRSIYIAQNDCVSDVSDGINAKLGNLAENTDDINNFDNASRRLKDMLNQLTPDRVTGSIKKRKNYITQLTQELRTFEAAEEGLEGVRRKEQLVSAQINELLTIRKSYAEALVVASEDSRKRELYAQYDALCKEVEEKEAQRDANKVSFPLGVPTAEEFKVQLSTIRKMEEAKTTLKGLELSISEHEEWSKLQEMFETEVPSESNIDFSIEMLSDVDKQKEEIARQEAKLSIVEEELDKEIIPPVFEGPIGHKVFLGVGIGIVVVGVLVLAGWYTHIIPIMEGQKLILAALFAIACGAIFSLVGAVLGYKVEKQKGEWQANVEAKRQEALMQQADLKEKIDALKETVRNVHETIGDFLGKFHVRCAVGEYQSRLYELKNQLHEYRRLQEQLTECMGERESYQSLRAQIVTFAKQYDFYLGEDYTADITALQNKAIAYQMAEAAFLEISKKREAFEQRQDKSFWTKTALCPYSIDELNQMIELADAKLEELKSAKAQYAKQLEDLQEQLDLRDEKYAELKEMQNLQEEDMKKYHIIRMTHEFLQRAKEQFTAKYMDPIANGFSKYYKMLTQDASGEWIIDANINLKVREQGELRDTRWLSAGYQDLIGVCMRLALVEAMYKEEKPFLILDDPFVNLDKEKVEAGNQLLLSVGSEYQVIYFTCHDSRCPII
ncbi:MAG: AAA family ATPase [Agathobacter sp.]|nr:AAA family ATPase [Agathobacter sp.]